MHFSFIGNAQFRQAMLFCDSSYYFFSQKKLKWREERRAMRSWPYPLLYPPGLPPSSSQSSTYCSVMSWYISWNWFSQGQWPQGQGHGQRLRWKEWVLNTIVAIGAFSIFTLISPYFMHGKLWSNVGIILCYPIFVGGAVAVDSMMALQSKGCWLNPLLPQPLAETMNQSPISVTYCIKTDFWEWMFGEYFYVFSGRRIFMPTSSSKFVVKCAAKILKIGWQMKNLCPKILLKIGNGEFCMGIIISRGSQ